MTINPKPIFGSFHSNSIHPVSGRPSWPWPPDPWIGAAWNWYFVCFAQPRAVSRRLGRVSQRALAASVFWAAPLWPFNLALATHSLVWRRLEFAFVCFAQLMIFFCIILCDFAFFVNFDPGSFWGRFFVGRGVQRCGARG